MKSKIINLKYKEEAFTCPSCSTYSKHDWKYNYIHEKSGEFYGRRTRLLIANLKNCIYVNVSIVDIFHFGIKEN